MHWSDRFPGENVFYKEDGGILYNCDCLEIMELFPINSIDCIATDPPYGTTSCRWDNILPLELMWNGIKRVRKDDTPVILFGREPFSSALRMSNVKEYKYDWIYIKSQASNFLNAKKQPLRNHENISVFYKRQCKYNPIMRDGKPYKRKQGKSGKSVSNDTTITDGAYVTVSDGGRYPLSVMDKFSVDTGLHPTQKPVKLMEYLIKTYTGECDIVLDFTCGSGTTLVAAKNLGRRWIGIETDIGYCETAKQRLVEGGSIEKDESNRRKIGGVRRLPEIFEQIAEDDSSISI